MLSVASLDQVFRISDGIDLNGHDATLVMTFYSVVGRGSGEPQVPTTMEVAIPIISDPEDLERLVAAELRADDQMWSCIGSEARVFCTPHSPESIHGEKWRTDPGVLAAVASMLGELRGLEL